MYSKLLSAALFATTYTVALANPTVYLIRHGEKPDDGSTGLSTQGEDRAQCLRQVFDGKRNRPYLTVLPLAEDLGLDVDISCDRDDPKCVKDAVDNYDGDGNILICWEHDALTDIAEELGDDHAPEYPDDRYDLIWTNPSPYDEITAETSERCPGLD
ncbi:hypothetical protein BDW75DRAFT_248375 [Aspergillus navahoensis]